MDITGIISEYNPFHNGHQKLLELHKEKSPNSAFIAVMSGNIMQRGEFPLLDKWTRAQLAVSQGIDLAIELPTAFAVQSAQYFATGGVELLSRLGIVDYICCGCEHTNEHLLYDLAKISLNPEIGSDIRQEMRTGKSYPHAYSKAILDNLEAPEGQLYELDSIKQALYSSNSILAFEYIKALIKTPNSPKLSLIQRQGVNHGSLEPKNGLASGTAIRQMLVTANSTSELTPLKNLVPKFSYSQLQALHESQIFPNLDKAFTILKYKLAFINPEELTSYYGIKEGLEFKLLKELNQAHTWEDYLTALKSKRYPHTTLQRLLIYILLDLKAESVQEMLFAGPQYIRVLAFNNVGAKLLKQLKKQSTLPIITKTTAFLDSRQLSQPQDLAQKMLALDIRATNLRELILSGPAKLNKDFYTSPTYIEL